MNPSSDRPSAIQHERGAALIMALIILLISTLLGVAAMNTTVLEEKMAGNTKDRNLAFQAAETALLAGEQWVNNLLSKPYFPDNNNGLYQPYSCAGGAEIPVWDCANWSATSVGAGVFIYAGGLQKVKSPPKYIVEDMGEIPEEGGSKKRPSDYRGIGNTVMRITGRGTGGTDNAVVMVQSTFSRPF